MIRNEMGALERMEQEGLVAMGAGAGAARAAPALVVAGERGGGLLLGGGVVRGAPAGVGVKLQSREQGAWRGLSMEQL